MESRYLVGFDVSDLPVRRTDVLIIGGGIAGLTTALIAARKLQVKALAKSGMKETSTWYAQGGIAAPLAPDDSRDLHFSDTIEAGAGLCDPRAVRVLVDEAEEAVSMLIELGTGFDTFDGVLSLGREGGHSVSRVVHSGDATGRAVVASLIKAVMANERVSLDNEMFVIDLLVDDGVCVGALAYDEGANQLVAYLASAVVMAAGGMGQIYEVTTNPAVATGDGQAMANRRGAALGGLEFVQFHPTALATSSNPRFLISEVVRGEGAFLVDDEGSRFMVGRHPLAELAPRDMVGQAAAEAMKTRGIDHVFLDARHIPMGRLKSRFPGIWDHCLNQGFDLSKDLIPVEPAAHYLIGGIRTDLDGRTDLPGLFAGGEVASTGVHGANRLASNSLLEGLVFSRRISDHLLGTITPGRIRPVGTISAQSREPGASLASVRSDLRRLMSAKAGVVRTVDGLEEAAARIGEWLALLEYEYANPRDWETVNMITMADLIVKAALARRESLGVHLVAG